MLSQLRGVDRIENVLEEALWQAGRTSLPFVRCAGEGELAALDARFEASCTGHVANRASRAQGHALHGPAHHAPVFGAVFGRSGRTRSTRRWRTCT